MKPFLCLAGIFLSATLCAQVGEIVINPGLSIGFQQSKWEKIKTGLSHPGFSGEWGEYRLASDSTVKIQASIQFIDRMEFGADMTLAVYDEGVIKAGGEKRQIGNCLIFRYPNAVVHDSQKAAEKIVVMNPMYFAQVYFSIPTGSKVTVNALEDEIIKGLHIDSPQEADNKEGWPVTAENLDSMVVKETARMKDILEKMYSPKHLSETEMVRFKKEVRDDLIKKMQAGYTYAKFYGYRDKILRGDIPTDTWLNFVFKKIDFPELKMLEDFDGVSDGKIYDAIMRSPEKMALSKLGFTQDGSAKLIDRISKERRTDTVYWALIGASPDKQSIGKLYAFRFKKSPDSWQIKYYALADTMNIYDESSDLVNNIHVSHYASDDTTATEKSDNILLVSDNRSHSYFLANGFSDSTSFISIYPPAGKQYAVMYDLTNPALHQMGGRPQYRDIPFDDEYKWQEYRKTIPPAERIYSTIAESRDVNANGLEDCYYFRISNGKILQLDLYEADDKGIQKIPVDSLLRQKIKADYDFQHVLHLSQDAVNNEDWGSDPLQVYDEEDPEVIFKDSLNPRIVPYLVNAPGDSAMHLFTAFMNCFRMQEALGIYAPVDFSKMNFTGVKSLTIMCNDFKSYAAEFYPDGRYKSLFYYESNTAYPENNLVFDYDMPGKFAVVKNISDGKRQTLFNIYAKGDTLISTRVFPSLIFKKVDQILRQRWDEQKNNWDTGHLENIANYTPCAPGDKRCSYRKVAENTFEFKNAHEIGITATRKVAYPFTEKIVFNKRGLIESFDSKESSSIQHCVIKYSYY